MKLGIATLIVAYMMSQFYRAFLAVLTPVLRADIGATPEDLAFASGFWFLIFAAFQIPVGAALDRIGPRVTSAALFAIGGAGGAAVFASATAPWHITLAMALIGIGCSPILMASYFIFARSYAPAVFGTLAGVTLGLGNLGNIFSAAPLAWAVEVYGWRETVWVLAAFTFTLAALVYLVVKDPPPVDTSETGGSVLTLLANPLLWPIFAIMIVNYAPAAGLRGLWIAPFAEEVHGASVSTIGLMTLGMGIAMVLGNFAYGPLERLLGTRKWLIFGGNALGALGCVGLAIWGASDIWLATALFALVGFAGSSFPILVAHAKAFCPPHLLGRGVTLINLFGIGGVAVFQFISRPVYQSASTQTQTSEGPFVTLFLFYSIALGIGLVLYLFAKDRTD